MPALAPEDRKALLERCLAEGANAAEAFAAARDMARWVEEGDHKRTVLALPAPAKIDELADDINKRAGAVQRQSRALVQAAEGAVAGKHFYKGLTKREAECLDAIKRRCRDGAPVTNDSLGEDLGGIRGCTVACLLAALERKGFIRRTGKARTRARRILVKGFHEAFHDGDDDDAEPDAPEPSNRDASTDASRTGSARSAGRAGMPAGHEGHTREGAGPEEPESGKTGNPAPVAVKTGLKPGLKPQRRAAAPPASEPCERRSPVGGRGRGILAEGGAPGRIDPVPKKPVPKQTAAERRMIDEAVAAGKVTKLPPGGAELPPDADLIDQAAHKLRRTADHLAIRDLFARMKPFDLNGKAMAVTELAASLRRRAEERGEDNPFTATAIKAALIARRVARKAHTLNEGGPRAAAKQRTMKARRRA